MSKNNLQNGQSAAKQIETKDIPGFEEFYSISKNGDVYSKRQNKFLKNRLSKDGYNRVALCVNGKRYEHRVARLVAMTYIDNPNELPQVNHIDLNTLNDSVSNLEWCTNKQNADHAALAGNREGIIRGIYKAYKFTNVFNNKSFVIIGFKNLMKHFNVKDTCKKTLSRRANTGDYIKKGVFKGFKVDVFDLKVQRLSPNQGVDSSESK